MSVEKEIHSEELGRVQRLVADATMSISKANAKIAGETDVEYPDTRLQNTHRELLNAYRETERALSRTEQTIDRLGVSTDTPFRIKKDHAERLKEHYDGPVLCLALITLERNRLEWLWVKPETNGAQQVERHGLTETQRQWLNELQEAWRQYDQSNGDNQ